MHLYVEINLSGGHLWKAEYKSKTFPHKAISLADSRPSQHDT